MTMPSVSALISGSSWAQASSAAATSSSPLNTTTGWPPLLTTWHWKFFRASHESTSTWAARSPAHGQLIVPDRPRPRGP